MKSLGVATYTCHKGGVFRNLQIMFNINLHTSSAILVHFRTYDSKIFFNRGESINIRSEPFHDFHKGDISKFS